MRTLWERTTDVITMLSLIEDHTNGSSSVGVYSSRHLTPRKLMLWSCAALHVRLSSVDSVRGFHRSQTHPDRFLIRLSWNGSNGDCDNIAVHTEKSQSADLLRCVVGNPYVRSYLSVKGGSVNPIPEAKEDIVLRRKHVSDVIADVAFSIYLGHPVPDRLDNDRLAVLADMLQDNGCDCGQLLSHLRHPGPHVRGCWALDLILDPAGGGANEPIRPDRRVV